MTATQASASQLLTHRERVPSGVGIQCPCGSSPHVMATIRKAFRMEFLERKYGELEFLETGFSFVSKAPFRFRRLPMCLVFRVFPRERVGGRVSEMSGDGGGQRTPAHCSPGCEDLPCGGGTRDPCALPCARPLAGVDRPDLGPDKLPCGYWRPCSAACPGRLTQNLTTPRRRSAEGEVRG